MTNSTALVSCLALTLGLAAAAATDLSAQQVKPAYPEPRYPSYLRTPDNVDEVLPIARRLVRELKGLQGDGLGIAKSGDTVAVISNADSQPVFVEALRPAYA